MAPLNFDHLFQSASASARRLATRRFRAAGLHFLISTFVATCVAALTFTLWYPHPFDRMAGVLSLFLLLVTVDVTLGPLLTAIAASPKKPARELRNDILIIVVLQTAAFVYGMYSVSLARPVHMAFEVDHFRVFSAANVDPDLLHDAPENLRQLSWTGPTLIAAAKPLGADEQLKAIELGLAGFDISLIPRNWRDYETQSGAAWNAGRPLAKLIEQYPERADLVKALVRKSGHAIDDLRFLPIISRNGDWIAVVASPGAHVIGYLPLQGFF